MLVLPSDSGYNSPCDGIATSSLHYSPERISKAYIKSEVRRKLRFESHTCWNSGSYFTPSKASIRLQDIARRLIQICDSFEKEFAESSTAENLTWTASILRLIGF